MISGDVSRAKPEDNQRVAARHKREQGGGGSCGGDSGNGGGGDDRIFKAFQPSFGVETIGGYGGRWGWW